MLYRFCILHKTLQHSRIYPFSKFKKLFGRQDENDADIPQEEKKLFKNATDKEKKLSSLLTKDV